VSRFVRALPGAAWSGWDAFAVAAILGGALFRLLWVLVFHQPFDFMYSDMAGYVGRGVRLAEGGPFERYDAFYPPGTHFLLGGIFRVFGHDQGGLWAAAAVWGTLSAAAPFFMWRVARLLLSPVAAALTAVFTAAWPLHATSAGYFLSETPSLAFLLASLWAAYAAFGRRGRSAAGLAVLAGVLGGVAVSMRPQFLLNLAIVAAVWLFVRRDYRRVALAAAGCALVVAGALLHNSLVADKPTGISENTGVTLFIGQCDVHTVRAANDAQFGPPPANLLGRGRIYHFPDRDIWDQGFFFAQAADCIRDNGWSHGSLLGRHVLDMAYTTVIWPQVNEPALRQPLKIANLVYILMLPAVLIGTLLLIRERRRRHERAGELDLLLQLLTALVTALVFFGDPRFRMPYDFFGLALLGAVVADLFTRRRAVSAVDSRRS
jgi:hypothetical protein